MKRIMFAIPVFFIAALLLALSYRAGNLSLNFPDEGRYPLRGIDVSHNNGPIDWTAVPREKYDFAYIKATAGGDWTDPFFAANWNNAREAGIKVGASHDFSLCRDATEQALHFIATAPRDNEALAPAVDLGYAGDCKTRPAREEFLTGFGSFISILTAHYGTPPVIYATGAFHRDYLAGTAYAANPLWIRSIFGAPRLQASHEWHMWQYADNAHVPGIHGPVDVNVMRTN